MKILVVDDESSIRNLIRMQLEMEGYEVLAAADGREALERWNEGTGCIDFGRYASGYGWV